jgi:hypothetical protein
MMIGSASERAHRVLPLPEAGTDLFNPKTNVLGAAAKLAACHSPGTARLDSSEISARLMLESFIHRQLRSQCVRVTKLRVAQLRSPLDNGGCFTLL